VRRGGGAVTRGTTAAGRDRTCAGAAAARLASSSAVGRALEEEPANELVVVTEAGSYLRPIDSCITQLKAQGPSRTCNESKEEEDLGNDGELVSADLVGRVPIRHHPICTTQARI